MIKIIEIDPILNNQDYEACLAIRRSVFIEEQGVPEELEIENEEDAHHFLALYEEVPVATGRYRIKENFVKFERVACIKAFRGKGIAKSLMQNMQADCLKKYPEHLPMMHAQMSAVPFYLKLGWRPVGEIFQEAGVDHQCLIYLK